MIEWIDVILLGCLAGIFTGLIPGIHINLIATILLLFSPYLLGYFSLEELIIFIISMGVIHSFLDFIPSIIFGVPSSDTAMGVLPAHKLAILGKSREALFLSASGSLLGALFSLPLLIVLFFILSPLITFITPHIPYILCSIVILFILLEKEFISMIWPILFVSIISCYGLLLLNSFHLQEPLLVLFTGLFGISGLLFSLKDETSIHIQEKKLLHDLPNGSVKGIFMGNICAAVCSSLPGLGSAQAASLMSLFVKNTNEKIFLVITSSLNTTAFLVSVLTFHLLNKARNGAIVVVSQLTQTISLQFMIEIFFVIIGVCLLGFFLTLKIGDVIITLVDKINQKKMNLILILILLGIIFIVEGMYGILCLIGITSLGFLGLLLEIRRVHFMSILLVPVALYLI